jgi:hypothetical protein
MIQEGIDGHDIRFIVSAHVEGMGWTTVRCVGFAAAKQYVDAA